MGLFDWFTKSKPSHAGTTTAPAATATSTATVTETAVDPAAAQPRESQRIVKRVQHREAEVDAPQRHPGRGQPLADARDDLLEFQPVERGPLEPLGDLADEGCGQVGVACAHLSFPPVKNPCRSGAHHRRPGPPRAISAERRLI